MIFACLDFRKKIVFLGRCVTAAHTLKNFVKLEMIRLCFCVLANTYYVTESPKRQLAFWSSVATILLPRTRKYKWTIGLFSSPKTTLKSLYLRGIQKPHGQNFTPFWTPIYLCGHSLCSKHRQKWQILDHIPTYFCPRGFWMTLKTLFRDPFFKLAKTEL